MRYFAPILSRGLIFVFRLECENVLERTGKLRETLMLVDKEKIQVRCNLNFSIFVMQTSVRASQLTIQKKLSFAAMFYITSAQNYR